MAAAAVGRGLAALPLVVLDGLQQEPRRAGVAVLAQVDLLGEFL